VKHSRIVIVVVVFLIATGFLLLLQFSPFSHPDWHQMASSSSADTTSTNTGMNMLIAKENAVLGTKKWQDDLNKGFSVFIQAYANTVSVSPGQKIIFYASTLDPGTRYTISWYRLGWYNGDGARQMFATDFLSGHPQGYYDSSKRVLANCHSCHVDLMSGLVDANWQPSYTLTVPSDWTTGVYLAKFTDEHSNTTMVPFDVRGNAHARYLVVTPDVNYQAYNSWGGFSLFTANGNDVRHSIQASFNRPYMSSLDTNQLFDSELNAIRWLEMQGYDLSYVSDVDLHEHPESLMDHKALIFLGQDTFWSKEMRDGIEYARDHGVGIAFLGAETGTWQMRFDADSNGRPDRTIVSYRVTSEMHNLQFDPLYGRDNARVTTRWRDPFLSRPENALIGVMFSDTTAHVADFSWHTNAHLLGALVAATGLAGNKSYGCGLVGNAWDRVYDNGASPRGLVVLSTSKAFNDGSVDDVSNTTYYVAPSGAMVFAAGSLYWSRGLDGYRFHQDLQCPATSAVPELQRLMGNVMSALVMHHKPPKVVQEQPMGAPFVLNPLDGHMRQGRYLDTQNGSLSVNPSVPRQQKTEISASGHNSHVDTTSHTGSSSGVRPATTSTSSSRSKVSSSNNKKGHTAVSSSTEARHTTSSSTTQARHTAQKPQQASHSDSHTVVGSFRGGRQGLRVSNDPVVPRNHTTTSHSRTTSHSHTTTSQTHQATQHTTSHSHTTLQSHIVSQSHAELESSDEQSDDNGESRVGRSDMATQTALYQRFLRETLTHFMRSLRQQAGSQ
jgi:hypothetical protein